jgi:hypothetical protein
MVSRLTEFLLSHEKEISSIHDKTWYLITITHLVISLTLSH